ncbi:MAG: fliJ [Polaromonas sp.]|jgi:flagellar FliJ protein|nr:fliJ [Polaromonas sp.]MDB5845014.1 fliJ [Polaromonas sp.]MDB5939650.1 fliJ [Polaromonas sp.]
MPEKLPLATLIELAQTKTDDATRRLGQLQNAQISANAKLDMLVQYRQEYVEQFNIQLQAGLAASQLRNFQNFIGTLDGAIEQQRALTLQANTRLGHGRTDWQTSKRRLTSFGTLADRARLLELAVAGKKEQRESDERSARQFFLRATATTH